ncbi:alpha/beta fold hydrolase [Fischerella thermalis]|uniref:Alpha/beta hydrolase fold protein n=1 Tax=Fischerella thermalis JSC-11 TaxID=741277 RepID=G6FVH5_9CYAN|nr:alpha/beta hydrolase [Fischerella thermalis]PLZ84618.1 alpha/beta hydrolase [Fischerella thermalis WC217]EHC12230.1 alpha/beta hydrolase fold protein [Fischerella thermalis JSC-11]PLZ09049.1 alpha/beta hydrolase [Fischerella thermalis WC119]PLZ10458.1 alpha/beta hydrolase [Fischerella thermalis WC114]PLZ15624.1 alpha/beta hydrolase [Fischerella thermalis WC1110]
MNNLFRNSRRKLSQGLLFWREIGNGIPVVFLHGAWNDSSEWVAIMESLSADFHCFAPDLFGFGESDYPNIHYSIDLQVESLAEFLQALKLERMYLVGHSLGGWIAASYALKYPEQVYGLVLVAPEGLETEELDKNWKKIQGLMKRPLWIFKILKILSPLTKILGLDTQIEQDWQQRKIMLQYPTASNLLFLRQLPELRAELLQERLDFLTTPVLILQGGKDTPDALAKSNKYAILLPQANLKIIAHVGNNLPEMCAAIVAGEIRNFIKTNEL